MMQSFILGSALDFFLGASAPMTTMHPPLPESEMPDRKMLFFFLESPMKSHSQLKRLLKENYKQLKEMKESQIKEKEYIGFAPSLLKNNFDETLSKFEQETQHQVMKSYYESIDEPDLYTLISFKKIFQWGWSKIGPYIWGGKQENMFFFHLYEKNYGRLISHSYKNQRFYWLRLQMMHQAMECLKTDENPLLKGWIHNDVPDILTKEEKKLKMWSERLLDAWSFNDTYYLLDDLLSIYNRAWKAALPSPELKEEENVEVYEKRLNQAYDLFTERNHILHLLPELMASYHNKEILRAPKDILTKKIEDIFNSSILLGDSYQIGEKVEKPRPFEEIIEFIKKKYQAQPLSEKVLEGFFLEETMEEDILKEYMQAIEKDHWYLAQALCIKANKEKCTNLKWDEQTQWLNVYFQDTQNFLTILTKRSVELLTEQMRYKKYDVEKLQNIERIREDIFSWQEKRGNARISFLKSIKTAMNSEKDLWERTLSSIKNKALRKFLTGDYCENIPSYEQFRIENLFLGEKPEEKIDTKICIKSDRQILKTPQLLLKLPPLMEKSMPTTFNDYKRYVQKLMEKLSNVDCLTHLEKICQNNDRNEDSDYNWRAESLKIKQFKGYIQRLNTLLNVVLPKKNQKNEILDEIKTYRDDVLIPSYWRHLKTQKSKRNVHKEGFVLGTIKNFWGSGRRKAERLYSENKISEEVPIFGYGEENSKIKELENVVKSLL